MSEHIITDEDYMFLINYSNKEEELTRFSFIANRMKRNEIVRCMDCKYLKEYVGEIQSMCKYHMIPTYDYCYCIWGEKVDK